MASQGSTRKRKTLSESAPSQDDFVGVELDGVLSGSEDESDYESDPDNDESGSDQGIHGEESDAYSTTSSDLNTDEPKSRVEDDDEPNYRVVTDANGNERYEYAEIDPVYDSDDSDAQGPVNTIGNIPLSFYDSYPHIGYDINGKRIMRPATGEALDALLDSIEVPKGWTGLTDPETGKPLNLSQDELELLRRLQMGEVPEEGYDPYPVITLRL